MPTLRLLDSEDGTRDLGGEIFACAYTPDGTAVLSGGWDGFLRLWDVGIGKQAAAFKGSAKPIAACAIAPDGRQWLSACLDGLLVTWDPTTHAQLSAFMPHGRPLSAIVFSPDGKLLATASWDRNVILWNLSRDREGKTLAGHGDIVAGCRFTPTGQLLVSWSYDRTLRTWDVARGRGQQVLTGHSDRVTAGAISPDGRLVASGGRDCLLKLWDIESGKELASKMLEGEVRCCFFLLDGESLVAVDMHGRMTLHTLPDLGQRGELFTQCAIQCGDVSPSGQQIVLGCGTGQVRYVAIDELDHAPLIVAASVATRRSATMLQRMLGKSTITKVYRVICPVCHQSQDLAQKTDEPVPCSSCRRRLRVGLVLPTN